jgi:anti-sigma regulatory factor (Ser/Thr protein kinase)
MDRSRAVDLPLEAASVALSRRFVRAVLDDWGLTALLDEALLLTSEVVTNALLHAGTARALLEVHRLADGVRVEVTDRNPALPRVRRFSSSSGTGRGMALVEAWSRSWGTLPSPPGKTVWFELAMR